MSAARRSPVRAYITGNLQMPIVVYWNIQRK
jgi:hypothetical protein